MPVTVSGFKPEINETPLLVKKVMHTIGEGEFTPPSIWKCAMTRPQTGTARPFARAAMILRSICVACCRTDKADTASNREASSPSRGRSAFRWFRFWQPYHNM